MKKIFLKPVIIGFVFILLLSAYAHNKISTVEQDNMSEAQSVNEFARQVVRATLEVDAQALRDLVGENQFFSIECFVDGRDRNTVLLMNKDHIRDDLILDKDDYLGVYLRIFQGDILDEDVPVHTSSYLEGISFPVDWHTAGEEEVEAKLEDIYDTCMMIILTNNEYIPQIFILKDGIYAYSESNAILEPYKEFTGDWLIFEKAEEGYRILAVMNFQ